MLIFNTIFNKTFTRIVIISFVTIISFTQKYIIIFRLLVSFFISYLYVPLIENLCIFYIWNIHWKEKESEREHFGPPNNILHFYE